MNICNNTLNKFKFRQHKRKLPCENMLMTDKYYMTSDCHEGD